MLTSVHIPSSKGIVNFVTWPIQKKDNFARSTIPVVAFVASEMFTNLRSIFSLILAVEITIGAEILYRKLYSEKESIEKKQQIGSEKPKKPNRRRKKRKQVALKTFEKPQDIDPARLKEIKALCIPLGKFLSKRSYCIDCYYQESLAKHAFNEFDIDRNIIEGAWKQYPKENDFEMRLDYLFKRANAIFQSNFKKHLENVLQQLKNRTERDIYKAIEENRL